MTPTLCLAFVACLAGNEPGSAPVFGSPEYAAARPCPCVGGSYQPRVGDLVLFQHTGLKLNLVYVLGGSPGVTHSAIVVSRPEGGLALLESPGMTYPAMLSDIPSRLQSYKGRVWYRHRKIPLTPEQSRKLTAFACAQEGKPYDVMGFIVPPFGFPVRKWTRRCYSEEELHNTKSWFCSSIVAAACMSAGLIDACRVRPRFTDPSDLKRDRFLDLSDCWDRPISWHRCGAKTECWWSQTCSGEKQTWR